MAVHFGSQIRVYLCVCVYLNARPCAQKLLTLDPALRVTARAALEHAFFLDLDRSEL